MNTKPRRGSAPWKLPLRKWQAGDAFRVGIRFRPARETHQVLLSGLAGSGVFENLGTGGSTGPPCGPRPGEENQ